MNVEWASSFLGQLLGRDVSPVLLSNSNHTVFAEKNIGLVLKCYTGAIGFRAKSNAEALRHFHAVESVVDALCTLNIPVMQLFKLDSRSTFLCQGTILTTHRLVEIGDADARQFAGMAAALHSVHRGLRRLDATATLWPLHSCTVSRYGAIRDRLPAESRAILDSIVGKSILPRAHASPIQLLHGDADFRNCFASADGLYWGDWENLQMGPIEWDVASTIASIIREFGRDGAECFLENYTGRVDLQLLFDCVDFCIAQDEIWSARPGAPESCNNRPLRDRLVDAAGMRRGHIGR